jgi:replication factor A2
MPVTHVTLVGQVRSVNPQAIQNTYRIDDGTGLIEVKQWIDADNPDKAPRFAPDTYLRVFGRLQTFNGKLSVSAHHMRPIEDFNEVNYHMLEATYVHLSLTKGASAAGGRQQGGDGMDTAGGGGGDGMFVDGGYGAGGHSHAVQARLSPCSRNARAVFTYLMNAAGGDGQHISQVAAGTGMSNKDIMSAAEELLGEGLVYTTEDDETWAILDM